MLHNRPQNHILFFYIFIIGSIWGLSIPFTKIAASAGYLPFGLIFWQSVMVSFCAGCAILVKRQPFRTDGEACKIYLIVGLIGALIPNYFTYIAAKGLPAGIMALIIAIVPIAGYPMALALRLEPFKFIRFLGLGFGFAAMIMIAMPETSLPDRQMVWLLPIALLAPLFYAAEGNYLALVKKQQLSALEILFGASVFTTFSAFCLAHFTGHFFIPSWPLTLPEQALIGSSVTHFMAYAGFIWLVGKAGPVFSSQVGYISTIMGVLWSLIILSESYSSWVWGALFIMLCGIALVSPYEKKQQQA